MEHLVKYKNRKIYSKSSKGYLSLKNILKLVKQGVDIKVTEHGTNEDVTKSTLISALKYKNFNEEDIYKILRS